MDGTLDSIRPSDVDSTRSNMSYLYGRDPSILAYAERPIPTSKQNLISLYGDEEDEYTDDTTSDAIILQTVKVYLRVKPLPRKLKLSKEETEAYQIANATTLVTKLPSLDQNSSSLKGPKTAELICRKFTFTKIFGPETTQLHLFEQVIQQRMVDFLDGHNSTVMTYGTTSSGKSYTLQGTTTSPGIIPRGLEFVFSNITARPTPSYKPVHNSDVVCLSAVDRAQELESKNKLLTFASIDKHHYINAYRQMQKLLQEESPIRPSQACDAQYSVWVSFAEIYNENIFDLLSNECQKRRPSLKLGTDNHGRAFIKGLKTVCVNSGSEAYQVLMAGQYNLKVAATALNARSSRSHCIFTIKLLKYYVENAPDRVEVSTFSFCDLAGSERLKKTLNVGERLKEAQNINTSLLVLGRCLKSICEGQSLKQRNEHVGPFRESKLTRLFQRALSGKEQIALIVNVNPVPNLYVETQNVLNFSAIAKKIVVEPKQIKRRVSNSRFSQMVAQSVKSSTDWVESELTDVTEHITESELDASVFVHQDEYDDVIADNKSLKKEIAALKASMLQRDLQIRQELADSYTVMMKRLETEWKNRVRDVEEQQKDQLEWSVNRVETFYKDKISELTSRKRRRLTDVESADESDDERPDIAELEIENSRLTDKVETLKKKLKNLRAENEATATEKNKVAFELGLVSEELKSVKSLLSSAEEDLCRDGESRVYVEKLRIELGEKEAKIKKLKEFLDEAKEEYIAITADAGSMEARLKQRTKELAECRERERDLEQLFEECNVCLGQQTKAAEALEEKLNSQSNLLHEAEAREQNVRAKLVESEETIRALRGKIALLEKPAPRPQSVTPDSMLADVEIKEELLSECESEASVESPKAALLPAGIVNTTDSKILGIPMTAYDDDRESEMFLKVEEISVNGDSPPELRVMLNDYRAENEILKEKLERSRLEIDSLRERFEAVKSRLSDVDKQLRDYKVTRAIASEAAENSPVPPEARAPRMTENGCQTAEISGRDQTNQTSFVGTSGEERSTQTAIAEHEELADSLKELETLKIKYDQLEIEYRKKETLIKKLKAELENHGGEKELEELAVKYDQLKAECKMKEMLMEKLNAEAKSRDSEEDELAKLRARYEQLEAECAKMKKLMEKLREIENYESEEKMSKLRAKVDQLEADCKGKEKSMEKLKEALENHETEDEMAELRVKYAQLEADCKRKEKSIEKLKEALETHETEDELAELRIKYEQLEADCKRKETSMEKLKEALESHETEDELAELRVKYEQLEADCKRKEKEAVDKHKTEDELAELRVKYEQLEADCKRKEKEALENHETENELAELRVKYDQLESEYKENEALMEKLQEELKNLRDNNFRLEKSNEDRESLEKDLASAVTEKEELAKTLRETNELLVILEGQIDKCREEHVAKISSLEHELTVAKVREETKTECIQVQTNKIAEIESSFALRTKELEDRIVAMTKSVEQCETEKKELEQKLAKNFTEIEALERRSQTADKKEQEKDEEIRQLQKALKSHLATDMNDKKMEKEMKQTLKELNETKEALERVEKAYQRYKLITQKESQDLNSHIEVLKMREKAAEEGKAEILRLKTENEELKTSLADKDREMEAFLKNRDEMIAKYEHWVKSQQQELERGKREITRFQELFHRIPTTPRDKGQKPSEDALKPPVLVVDLSDSETKRTTRRTALEPPASCATSEVKRSTRKKRLFLVDDSCTDIEASDAVPPTPSPSTSTRSLRTRRK